MTPVHTVRGLLLAGPGEPLCDACLALACAVSLTEMRLVTRNLLARPEFRRGTACASCQRDVPTIVYPASCDSCGQPLAVGPSCCADATLATEAKAGGV
jgi:predicted amidophosphoribosyltransferase